MKRLSKLLLALFIACSITGCSQSTEVVDATYEIYIAGYDWGCGVNKTILTLDKAVDDVDKNDFMVSETKQVTDWEDEALPVVEKTLERVVDDAYSCDKDGQKIDGESKYIAIELYVSPNDGSPLLYSATTHYNTWSDPYYLNISLAKNGEITVDDKKVTKLDVSTEYTKKITAADALELEKFKASDGIELNYGHFNPKEPSNTLFMWLHGSGEGGTEDTNPQVTSLSNKVSAYFNDDFQNAVGNAYVLVPQCPTFWLDADGNGGEWNDDLLVTHGPSYYTNALMELIKDYQSRCGATKVVLAGCSAGGYMTMRLILDYPDYFAAAIPICEALPDDVISDQQLSEIKDLPLYFIYSNDDPSIIPEKFEIPTINRLKNLGATNLHVATFDSVIDTSGKYNDLNDGDPYQYNGHWSWIYFDNNEADCDEHGEKVWQWIGEQVK